MKKILSVLAALLIAALLIPSALADDDRTITVTGTASVTVQADTAIVSLAVETTADNVTDAMRENAERITAVLDALKAEGIPEADLVTESFYINTVYDFNSIESRIKGYSVTNGLSVTVRDMSQVGHLIDTAFTAGANQCNGVRVTSTKAGEASDQALADAIAEGRRRAGLVASAAGGSLGRLLSVSENSSGFARETYASAKAVMNADMGTQIIADGLDYSAAVVLVFEMLEAR